jgi:hypothetical protein
MKILNQHEILAVSGSTLPENDCEKSQIYNFTYLANEMIEGASIGLLTGIFFGPWTKVPVFIGVGALLGGGIAALRFGAHELDKHYDLF